MKPILVIISLLICGQAPAATIYKCVSSDGKTTFSQHPCSEQAEELDVTNPRSNAGNVPAGKTALQQLQDIRKLRDKPKRTSKQKNGGCDHLSSTRRRNMVVQDKLFKCMTKSELKKVLGSPHSVHSSSQGAADESWHYHYLGGASTHVFFDKNGLVETWSGWR
jgi:hypothetical protein